MTSDYMDSDDEEMLKDNLVASCYSLISLKENQDTVASIAVNMIKEGIGDTDISILAMFVEKLLTFYASDEAVPLLESQTSSYDSVVHKQDIPIQEEDEKSDDCPFDADDFAEPTDDDLAQIESGGFLQNLWESSDEKVDFSMGGFVEEVEEVEEEPDLSRMTRRERKRWKRQQRIAKRAAKRHSNSGFEGMFETARKHHHNKNHYEKPQEKICYDFDVNNAEAGDDTEIGRLVGASFEKKKEGVVQSSYVSKGSNNPPQNLPAGLGIPAVLHSPGNPFKRRYDWDMS